MAVKQPPPYVTNRDDASRTDTRDDTRSVPRFPNNPWVGLGVQDHELADVADWSDIDDLIEEQLMSLTSKETIEDINNSDWPDVIKQRMIETARDMAAGNIRDLSEDEGEDRLPQADTDQGRNEPEGPE